MSTESAPTDAATLPPSTLPRECADWRTRVDDETCVAIAADARFAASTVANHVRGGDGCNHDRLDGHPDPSTGLSNGPGVHDIADKDAVGRVRASLDERLAANLGGTVYFSTGQLVDGHAIGFNGQRASAALRELADSDGELYVERTNPDANQARWAATWADGESA